MALWAGAARSWGLSSAVSRVATCMPIAARRKMPRVKPSVLAYFVGARTKVDLVALRVTRIGVLRVWIARRSRRKIQGTRQEQPGLLATALPLTRKMSSVRVRFIPRCIRGKSMTLAPAMPVRRNSKLCGPLSLHVLVLAQVTNPEEAVDRR